MSTETVSIACLALLVSSLACRTSPYVEISVETPLKPKLDISKFQRVLIAGFVADSTNEVNANLETARLLRSQLRTNSRLQVIDAEVIELIDIAEAEIGISLRRGDNAARSSDEAVATGEEEEDETLSEEELEEYEAIFANVSYWRQLGEEYQNPLIVTGTVYFTPHQRSGMITREREVYDALGRRQVLPIRAYRERQGYVLSPKFIFIDGNTGITLYTERHREEILYDSSRNTPALSSYFELMDRLLPSFLGSLSSQSIRGTRILLK